MVQKTKNLLKRIFFKIKTIGAHVCLCNQSVIGIHSRFEGYNYIGQNTVFDGMIGYGSYIGINCNINANIKRFVSIGPNVQIISGLHPTSTFVSTYPSFYSIRNSLRPHFIDTQKFDEYKYSDKGNKYAVSIGNDVWIAANALILSGISIGDGAIIAAGSVVCKDVPPYAIVGGVPARILKYRFSEEQIKQLLKIEWWNRPIEWIKKYADSFSNIEDFIRENYQ